MTAAVQKTKIIRGSGLEMVRHDAGRLGSLDAYLLVSDITKVFSKESLPKSIGLLTAFEIAVVQDQKISLVLPSNKRISKATVETDERNSCRPFVCWTGTMTAYAEPHTPFNRSKMFSQNDNALVYPDPKTGERWLFLLSGVPAEHLDKPNAILIAEHPLYSLEVNGKDIIVKPDAADILFDFAPRNGWYSGDPKYDIPIGEAINRADKHARQLIRVEYTGRVGLVARCYDYCADSERAINLAQMPSLADGVAVEAPDAKATRDIVLSIQNVE